MAKAQIKTKVNDASVAKFLDGIADDQRRADCKALAKIMERITRQRPRMWGTGIVGFGSYHYVYASGREGDWPLVGFAPRKQDLTLYIMSGFEAHDELLQKLGKFKTGKSCLYVKKLDDVDGKLLEKLIKSSVTKMRKKA